MVAGCSAAPEERSESGEAALSSFGSSTWIKDPFWYNYPAKTYGRKATGVFAVMPNGECPDITVDTHVSWNWTRHGTLIGVRGDDWKQSWGYGNSWTYYQTLYDAVVYDNSVPRPDGELEFPYSDSTPFCVYHFVDMSGQVDDAGAKRWSAFITAAGGTSMNDSYSPTYVGQICLAYVPGCIGSDCGCVVVPPPSNVLVSTSTGPLGLPGGTTPPLTP
jgi:hypothetical protein